MMADNVNTSLDDQQQIETLIENAKKQSKNGKRLAIGGGIAGVIVSWMGLVTFHSTGMMYLGMIVFVVAIVTGVMKDHKGKALVKEKMSATVIPDALSEVFQNVQYFPQKLISKDIIEKTDMGFPFSHFEGVFGSDLIRAKYKDVSIEMSDIYIYDETTDSEGHSSMHKKFKGSWLICDFKKRLSADVIVSENKKQKKPSKKTILTDNDAFNNKYTVRSEHPEEAFYVLTPHMMEFMLQMDEKADGQTYFHFMREGKVHIAIDSDRDLFEVNKVQSKDYDALKQQIKDEVQYIVDIIDALQLVDSLFEEDVK